MGLLNYKAVLVLLLVIGFNVAVFILLEQLNFFIHGDLYHYGLIFSLEWAVEVWHYNLSCWAFILGATAFAAFAVLPHYVFSRALHTSRFLMMTSFLLPVLALIYEGLSIFFLSQIDFIARNYFSNFGISSDFDWILTYEPIIWAAYVLMIISLVVLIIPAVKALGIIRRESVDKSD